jgi:selenocysteine-specific elongation factor
MMTDLILGTAGHIDHGKTSLIKALTGTDTDRLPEEKRRGITIELGFAELTVDGYRLGIVDVPGHERFVRQMLAGATGMDMALLVVAADDSVKPQTREHLDVLRILDLPAGVIALSKCDLADPDWMALVEEEIRELVKGSFLEEARIVRTSSTTGEGLEELRMALRDAAAIACQRRRQDLQDAPFRMAIDRAFTIAGHGTVVTGSVSSGQARIGDQMVIQPGNVEVRVRGLQNHDRPAENVTRGQRAAINLAGIHHEDVTRGHELFTPGYLIPSRLVTARISMLPHASRALKHRSRVRLHIGTAEVLSTVSLPNIERIAPGESAFAQLFLGEPIVASWNQPFVLRSESPMETIAGGRILVPVATKLRRPSDVTMAYLSDLESTDLTRRASAAIYFVGANHVDHSELFRTAGITESARVYESLKKQGAIVELRGVGQRKTSVHRQVLEEYGHRIAAALSKLHEHHPLATVFDRSTLANQFDYLGPPSVFDAILLQMEQAGAIRQTAKGIGLADRGPQLSRNEKELLQELIHRYEKARFQPPTVKECQQQATRNQNAVPQLIALAASDGDLVEINSELYLHTNVERELRDRLRTALDSNEGLTMSQIREMLNTTRKYAVPFCEYLDRIGFTRRDGDLRRLA